MPSVSIKIIGKIYISNPDKADGDLMKIVIEMDEKEFLDNLLKAAMETDKEVVKKVMNGIMSELLASLNPTLMKKIAGKFIDMESEVNYRAGKE